MSLKGKVAIVTGASQGIGKEIALLFATHGLSVALAARNKSNLEQLLEKIRNSGGQAISILTDISDCHQVSNMINKTVSEFGGIDILINNAGVPWFGKAIDDTNKNAGQLFERLIATNLKGTWFCTKYAVPYFKKRNGGAIVNISSVHAHAAIPKDSAYSMTKGGILALTRSLAIELAPYNIRVNSISPGWIQTQTESRLKSRFGRKITDQYFQMFGDYENDRLKTNQPLRRVGHVRDVAECALFLVSEKSRFITGVDIPVDGGLTALLGEPIQFDLEELLRIKKRGEQAAGWLEKLEEN